MNYFGIGIWVYMIIGLIIGIRLINDSDWQETIDEYQEETRNPLAHLFRNKTFVIVLYVLLGVPIATYSAIKSWLHND